MYEDDVGAVFFKDVAHACEDSASYVGEVLALLHDVQVEVGGDFEEVQHLVEHLSVLTCHGHDGFELFGALLERFDEGGHLDSFGSGPEDEHYGFHQKFLVIYHHTNRM